MLFSTAKMYMDSGILKNSGELFDKLKARDFNATTLSTYDFSTLYATLPHTLIKDNFLTLLKESSKEKALLTLHVMTETHFLLRNSLKDIMHGLVKVYVMR